MRTVILEEHFSLPAASARVDKAVIARRGYKPRALRKEKKTTNGIATAT